MACVYIVVELRASIVLVGCHILKVDDHLRLVSKADTERAGPIIVGVKHTERGAGILWLAQFYNKIFISRQVYTLWILPSSKAPLSGLETTRGLVEGALFPDVRDEPFVCQREQRFLLVTVTIVRIINLFTIRWGGVFLIPSIARTRTRLRVGQECLSVGSGIVVLRQNFRTGKSNQLTLHVSSTIRRKLAPKPSPPAVPV